MYSGFDLRIELCTLNFEDQHFFEFLVRIRGCIFRCKADGHAPKHELFWAKRHEKTLKLDRLDGLGSRCELTAKHMRGDRSDDACGVFGGVCMRILQSLRRFLHGAGSAWRPSPCPPQRMIKCRFEQGHQWCRLQAGLAETERTDNLC